MYSFDLTDEQRLITQTAEDFAKEQMRPQAHECDESSKLPDGFLSQSWELGLACGAIPEELGGAGLERSAVTGALMCEALAHGDLSLALAMMSPALVAYPLVDSGTEAQKKLYLERFIAPKFPNATSALIEPSMDFDPADLQTTAEKKANGYVLNGKKCLAPLGTQAELFLIYAAEGGPGLENVQAYFVTKEQAGLTVGEKEKYMGLRALDTATLTLENVEVAADSRLGGEAGINFAKLSSYSRVALAAMAVGVAKGAYEFALDYAKERQAFGKPIASKQAIAFMVAEMAVEIESTRLLVWEAGWHLDKGEDGVKESYLAKMYADQMVLKVTDNAVQVLGGHGYVRDNPVERWLRDARGFVTFDGMAMV